MWKHCPEHINGMLGYRTTRSMKKYGYMEICSMTIVENFG